MWTLVIVGPPDILSVNKGSSYVSLEIRHNVDAAGGTLFEGPIGNRGKISIVERYVAPLRAAYNENPH